MKPTEKQMKFILMGSIKWLEQSEEAEQKNRKAEIKARGGF